MKICKMLCLTGLIITAGCYSADYSPKPKTPEQIAAAAAKLQAEEAQKIRASEIATNLNKGSVSNNIWSVEKSLSNQKGYAIFKGPGNLFYAIDVQKFKEENSFESMVAADIVIVGLIRDTAYTFYTDSVSSYTIYKDPKNGIEFSEGNSSSKDFEAIGAALEEENLSAIRDGLVSQFGLSEARATELASMAASVKNIADSQGRALTERDLESLEVKAMGASLADYKNAKAKGDTKAIEKMTAKAASLNRISPEQAKRLMKQLGL